jgi:transcription antitermination factor NusG
MNADASSPGAAEAPWLVVHTKPRCEKKFAALLAREKFLHELPLVPSVRKYRTQTKRFTKPLFPGYVFTRVPPELKPRLYQQDLLVRLITVDDQAAFQRQIDAVRAMIGAGFDLRLTPLLRKGARVRITGGPLHGVEGMVDDPLHPKGVVIAIDVLQQGVLVRLPPEQLNVLP